MKYKDCGLTVGPAEAFLPSMQYSRIEEKYMQHGTSLNRNEVNSGRCLFYFLFALLSRKTLKIKCSGFSRPLHSVF